MWFVAQKIGNVTEDTACEECKRALQGKISDAFAPKYEVLKKRDGAWRKELTILFPGYFFIEADSGDVIKDNIKLFAGYGKPIDIGGFYQPLAIEEQRTLAELMNDSRIIELSRGNIYEGRCEVYEGPLKGRSELIKRIDRHKRIADIEIGFMGEHRLLRVGLEVVARFS